jgi:hypothetical protein
MTAPSAIRALKRPLRAIVCSTKGISRAPGTVAMADASIVDAKALEFAGAGTEQAFADILVEAAHDDADRQALAIERCSYS